MHDVQESQEATILVAGMFRVNSERMMVAANEVRASRGGIADIPY